MDKKAQKITGRFVEVETPIYVELEKFAQFLTKTNAPVIDYIEGFYIRPQYHFLFMRSDLPEGKQEYNLFCHAYSVVYSTGEFKNYIGIEKNGKCKLTDEFSLSEQQTQVIRRPEWGLNDFEQIILEKIKIMEEKRNKTA